MRFDFGLARALLMVSIATFAVGIIWTAHMIGKQHELQSATSREDPLWAASEAERGLLLLRNRVADTVLAGADREKIDGIDLIVDILFSRHDVLTSGDVGAKLAMIPSVSDRLRQLRQTLDALDRDVALLGDDPDAARRVLAALDAELATFHEVPLAAQKLGIAVDAELAAMNRKLHQALWGSFALFTVSVAILFGLTIRESRRNRVLAKKQEAATRALEVYGQNLQKLVSERTRDLERATREAQQANRSKTEFFANMCHELRTPLNAILGFSEIIKSESFGPVGQRRYVEYASDIQRSGRILLGLIGDLMALSRIENGSAGMEFEALDLAEVLVEAAEALEERSRRLGIVIRVTRPEQTVAIYADRAAMRQTLLNLIGNAVKFNRRGGTVDVSLRIASDYAVAVIADTGQGMTPEEIASAQKPLSLQRDPYVRTREGAGLGLSVAKALLDLHGASLEITSAPGTGTVVEVRCPLRRPGSDGLTEAALATA